MNNKLSNKFYNLIQPKSVFDLVLRLIYAVKIILGLYLTTCAVMVAVSVILCILNSKNYKNWWKTLHINNLLI